MSWFALVWKLVRDTAFRKAVKSILWPKVIRPLIQAAAKRLMEAGYQVVLRSVGTAEEMAERGDIRKDEKWKTCAELIAADAKSKGIELSSWARNMLIELAVAEIGKKWEEFG